MSGKVVSKIMQYLNISFRPLPSLNAFVHRIHYTVNGTFREVQLCFFNLLKMSKGFKVRNVDNVKYIIFFQIQIRLVFIKIIVKTSIF